MPMTHTEFLDTLDAVKLDQTQFAKELGVSVSTVNQWALNKEAVPHYAVAFIETLAKLHVAVFIISMLEKEIIELRGE